MLCTLLDNQYLRKRKRQSQSLLLFTPCFCSSSLSHSHSGRSSLRSSTEEDDPTCSSRNSSICTPRYTVLMLGAAEVGKTLLTNQFMSSSDIGTYSQLTGNNSKVSSLQKAFPK